jgi:Lrp/AsnC family transcriptional regulator, leucine-responsive regulatory protein
MIDETDIEILTILQENARTSNAEIARRIGMAPSAIFDRIRKLEERGVIQEYTVRVAPAALGLELLAFVFVRSDDLLWSTETEQDIAGLPEVQEVHHIAGEDCFLVKVRAANTEALGRFLREKLGTMDKVRSTRTTIVLTTVKESGRLPLPATRGEEESG